MAETYYSLTDIVKLCDNLVAAMPTSFYSGIMTVRTGLANIPAADVVPVVTESPYMQAAIDSVIDERKRQINIWGCQYDASMFEFMSILGEEYGELCEAVNETCFKNPKHPERGGLDNVYKEASHVAAVAVKLMEALLSGGTDMRQKEDTK